MKNNLFVNYKIAAKLKDKGFDEECLTIYQPYVFPPYDWKLSSIAHINLFKQSQNDSHKLDFTGYRNSIGIHYGLQSVTAPLFQQVLDWLESKNIHIEPVSSYDENGKVSKHWRVLMILPVHIQGAKFSMRDFTMTSIEEAIDKALDFYTPEK